MLNLNMNVRSTAIEFFSAIADEVLCAVRVHRLAPASSPVFRYWPSVMQPGDRAYHAGGMTLCLPLGMAGLTQARMLHQKHDRLKQTWVGLKRADLSSAFTRIFS